MHAYSEPVIITNFALFSINLLQSPVVFHFDLEETDMMSFDVFLVKFEAMLLRTIVNNQVRLLGEDTGEAIQRLMNVATKFYDRNLLE